MITKRNFKDVLDILGFKENNGFFEKVFPDGVVMKVSFSQEKLYYPDDMKGKDRNTGFDKSENFVAFECVNRLLEKGYQVKNIELEREWRLGHEKKGGRSDICVLDDEGNVFLIIDCKTWGKEFDDALKRTKADGDQLFSYWQQEQSCKWMALYTSDIQGNRIEYKSPAIDCSDNPNIVDQAMSDKSIKLYRNANTVNDRYDTWYETYGCNIEDNAVFSENSTAYSIGETYLKISDLCDFTPDDKIANKFLTILRDNNISDRENAFNRLVALFTCKLVDETKHKNDDKDLDFQYKRGESYDRLLDRLQELFHTGMNDFLHEDIYYLEPDYPVKLFKKYDGADRKGAIEDLKERIRELKYYSNNDFAFMDVHNKDLFYKNGKILVDVVKLFQGYRIVYSSKHQFLGDLFEQLLNDGFKQNEGQYFTPMPITRFIWDSLPVSKIIETENGTVYPRIIDYACGAGHFLTEAVEAVNFFAGNDEGCSNNWVKDCIFGIEKDYRLARVSKISLFMNGAGDGNIIYGDGLECMPDKEIIDGTFDILVSNPPYSVKDFKTYIMHSEKMKSKFTLLDSITETGGEIETLFVERIEQLLKPKGVAAVILPSSFLVNNKLSYIGAREILMKNFYIHAIVSLGNKTFSATDVTTVIFFLEKFDEPPKVIDLCADTVNAIFSGAKFTKWDDQEIFDMYLSQIDVDDCLYLDFVNKKLTLNQLKADEYFKMYVNAFSKSNEAKDLIAARTYQHKDEPEQIALYTDKLYEYSFKLEREKLLYFTLVYRQKTVIISAPKDTESQTKFLGYNWSKRRGNEGIQIESRGGKMYDDNHRDAEGTLADAIRKSFCDENPLFTYEQKEYAKVVDTKDIFDFSRVSFDKSMQIGKQSANSSFNIQSRYNLRALSSYSNVKIKKGNTITESTANPGQYKVVAGGTDYAYTHDTYNRDENIITVSASGAAGYVNFWREKIFASDCITIQADSLDYTLWIYYYLKSIQDQIYLILRKGMAQTHVYSKDIEQIPIPDIDQEGMQQLVSECKKLEERSLDAQSKIEGNHVEINRLFDELDNISEGEEHQFKLSNEEDFDVSIGKRVLKSQLDSCGTVPVYSANVTEPFGKISASLLNDFSIPSTLWGIDGEWITAYMPENSSFYPTDHCGVLRCKNPYLNPRYLTHLLEKAGNDIGFSRSNRASIDRVKGITINVIPSREKQDTYINKIQTLEKEIFSEKEILTNVSAEISGTVNRYIK